MAENKALPKEVAKNIYDRMKGFRVKNSHRKKCALEAVDLLMTQAMEIESEYSVGIVDNEIRFLEKVKSELEEL